MDVPKKDKGGLLRTLLKWHKSLTVQVWLGTFHGQEWLECRDGREWLESKEGRVWLGTFDGQVWLKSKEGREIPPEALTLTESLLSQLRQSETQVQDPVVDVDRLLEILEFVEDQVANGRTNPPNTFLDVLDQLGNELVGDRTPHTVYPPDTFDKLMLVIGSILDKADSDRQRGNHLKKLKSLWLSQKRRHERTVSKLEQEKSVVLEQFETVRNENNRIMNKILQMEKEISDLEEAMSKLKKENSDMMVQFEIMCIENSSNKNKILTMENEKSGIQEAMPELEKEKSDVLKKLQNTNDNYNILTNKILQMENEKRDLEEMVRKKELEKQDMLEQSKSVFEEYGNLKYKVPVVEKENEELKTKQKQAEREQQDMEEDMYTLRTLLHQARERCSNLAENLKREMLLVEKLRQHEDIVKYQKEISESQKKVHETMTELQKSIEEQRWPVKDKELTFLGKLPNDVKMICIQIKAHIGGQGPEFAQLLLGNQLGWEDEDIKEDGGFFTQRRYWRLIKFWVENTDSSCPLTLDHFNKACSSLLLDPKLVEEISDEHRSNLENNFHYLIENLEVVDVALFLRDRGNLPEPTWRFLLRPGTSLNKIDRLLAVIYSLGERGYQLLLECLKPSCHHHVRDQLIPPQRDAETEEHRAFPIEESSQESSTGLGGIQEPEPASHQTSLQIEESNQTSPKIGGTVHQAGLVDCSSPKLPPPAATRSVRQSTTPGASRSSRIDEGLVKSLQIQQKIILQNLVQRVEDLNKNVPGYKDAVQKLFDETSKDVRDILQILSSTK